MDISAIQDLLSDFSTFAGNIGDFLKIPVQLINGVAGNDSDADVTESETASSALSSE